MRGFLLAGVSLLAMATAAGATPLATFTYTGSVQNWTVPQTANYDIAAAGAQGGGNGSSAPGGPGDYISGIVGLTAGQTLNILVGGTGYSGVTGGGGGGTFVTSGGSPLVVAGGGGGAGAFFNQSGLWGSRVPAGMAGRPTAGNGQGGTGGSGGQAGYSLSPYSGGGGGGGFSGNGGAATGGATGGTALTGGGAGGFGTQGGGNGGLGGGGGGGGNGTFGGGGGGGGFSGGGAGGTWTGGSGAGAGGGGGSYLARGATYVAGYGGLPSCGEYCGPAYYANDLGSRGPGGGNFGAGYVSITEAMASAPEPASLELLGAGLGMFGLSRRRRR